MSTEAPFNQLNPSQQKAVNSSISHLLIVAGPGTGKTHTLTMRIARMVSTLNKGEKILAITFTNKAAAEMRERLARILPQAGAQLTIGTFHQFCHSVLRRYFNESGLAPDFSVATPEQVETMSRLLWPQLSLRERNMKLAEISRWKGKPFERPAPKDVLTLNAALRKNNFLDFDDLLFEALTLLRKNEGALAELRKTYCQTFVDEYQDINPAQHALLRMLIGPDNRLTAIGDPNQAIYGFRGADVKYFLSFAEDFKGSTVMNLSENYRSAANLLTASGQVIAKSAKLAVPELIARIYIEGRLTVAELPTDKAEAEHVVHMIERMVGGTSMFSRDSGRVAHQEEGEHSFGEIAVFYRLHSQARLLKEAFERSGIPYKIFGKTEAVSDDFIEDYFERPDEGVTEQGDKVALMTLHAAKGLEFGVVFIVGCEENLLPLQLEGMPADIEEERRLFYVGMTRAKQRLVLLRAKRRLLYGKTYQPLPSPFLKDIEESLKEYEKPPLSKSRHKADTQLELF